VILAIKKKIFSIYAKCVKNKISNELDKNLGSNIIILYTYEDKNKDIILTKLIDLLKKQSYKVQVLCYIDHLKNEKLSVITTHQNISYNSINLLGQIKENYLKGVMANKFSHIFVFDTNINPLIKLLTKRINAKYKLGSFSDKNIDILNVMIKVKEANNYDLLYNTMAHYSKVLK
jgi:hypothetical protein